MRKTRIACGDTHLAVRSAGEPAKPALILLHGWPHSGLLYEQVIDRLGEDSFVLAFDLPEIGDSRGRPRSAEKAVLADLVLSAAEKAGAKSVIVAGLDVGGMIAFSAARDHGSRIDGAVVMNTVIPGLDPWSKVLSDPRIWHFAFHKIPNLPETLVSGHERAYFDFFFDVLAGDRSALTDERRDAYAQAYARPEALKAGFDWYRAMDADARRNCERKRIATPILYLRGDADERSIEDYVRGIRDAGAEHLSSAVIRNSGEFSPVEAPDELIRQLKSFRAHCDKTGLLAGHRR
jgi:pimeloyl-ACP methyl ester carboxylesterase